MINNIRNDEKYLYFLNIRKINKISKRITYKEL